MSDNKNLDLLNERLESLLDEAIGAIRSETPAAEQVDAATARVWSELATQVQALAPSPSSIVEAEPLRTCDDVRALLPALVAGTLPEGRRLLVEDHTRTCIPCRRALQAIRAGRPVERPAAETAHERAAALERPGVWRWALAAAALVGTVLAGWAAWRGPWLVSQDELMQVRGLDGQVFALQGDGLEPVRPGDWIDGGQELRTAGGAAAQVVLADGSQVEINERSAFRVARRRDGLQLRVDRGSVIVEASEQGSGHLGVSTNELLVSVKGTIFAVSHGSKGSRVSVIEGEVLVEQGRRHESLYPGDQFASRKSVIPASFGEELAWSQNADRYLAMLEEWSELRHDLNQIMADGGVRTSSRLLDLVPETTVVYVAVPNPTATLSSVYQLLRERLANNPALAEWWQQVEAESWIGPVDSFVANVQELSQYLGEETVLALGLDLGGEPKVPVVLAEVTNGDALYAALAAQLDAIESTAGEDLPVVLLSSNTSTVPSGEHLYVWVGADLLVASTELSQINRLSGGTSGTASGGFATSPFRAQIDRAYAQGAQYLGAVDLETIFSRVVAEHAAADDAEHAGRVLELSGFQNARYLVVERKHSHDERAQTSAELTFEGERQGMAAWLAAPGPMGALDFISPDATLVSAFLMEDPAVMLDQILGVVRAEDGEDAERGLAEAEAELGLSLRDDLVATLGGEVAFAIDGPVLPVPSWKLILEVYDEARLQSSLETLAERAAEEARNAEHPGNVGLQEESVGGRTYYRLVLEAPEEALLSGMEIVYTYVDGYLVAAPTLALVERAIQQRDSGTSILTADGFRDLLPTDGYLDFSAVTYNRLGEVLSQFVAKMPTPEMSADQRARFDAMVGEMTGSAGASLYALYGDDDRIRLSSSSPNLVPFSGLGAVFGLSSMLQEIGGLSDLGRQLESAGKRTGPVEL
jgi:hypothetical protein